MKEPVNVDGAMQKLALITILAWVILGTLILRSPVLLVYATLHSASTGVFMFFFLRKEKEARNPPADQSETSHSA